MSEAVEKALDAWFPDEDWRTVGINQNMPTKWRAEMELALRAADAARAVPDEEVVMVLATSQSSWHECEVGPTLCKRLDACGCRDDANRLFRALRAAGLKVVRDE